MNFCSAASSYSTGRDSLSSSRSARVMQTSGLENSCFDQQLKIRKERARSGGGGGLEWERTQPGPKHSQRRAQNAQNACFTSSIPCKHLAAPTSIPQPCEDWAPSTPNPSQHTHEVLIAPQGHGSLVPAGPARDLHAANLRPLGALSSPCVCLKWPGRDLPVLFKL